MPHRLAENIEEERRVLHVAITRGRDRVVVIADANRPSPFLAELDAASPSPGAEPARLGDPAPTRRPGGTGGTRASTRASRTTTDAAAAGDETNPVFVALRTWRGEEARSTSMPPYVIFHDRTLHEIARRSPTSLRDLAVVAGVGPAKLERYGDTILAIVGRSAEDRSGAEPPGPDDGAPDDGDPDG